ncbi:MAG: 50S ribosomal protein L13 [Patescibacteria group bacterium]
MVSKTTSTKHKSVESIIRDWHIVDLKNKILGRSATTIAVFLQGKHKATYSAFSDSGDYVVVINSKHVKLTGNKSNVKEYQSYSGYPGGLKTKTFKEVLAKDPNLIIKYAVSGMLPKNKLRKKRLARLFIFSESEHTYQDKFKTK